MEKYLHISPAAECKPKKTTVADVIVIGCSVGWIMQRMVSFFTT